MLLSKKAMQIYFQSSSDIKDIYVPAKYCVNNKSGYNTSLKTIKNLIKKFNHLNLKLVFTQVVNLLI